MSNKVDRYRHMYERMVRTNAAHTFPQMRFMRHTNFRAATNERIGDRESCFESTMVHLTERFTGKEVFLVGSANKSTLLGLRTEKLIDHVKPEKVFVMTNPEWWTKANLLRYVRSQDEMNEYEANLEKSATHWKNINFHDNSKRFTYYIRAFIYQRIFQRHFHFDYRHKFWLPGFEMKVACESAERNGADLEFLGSEFNQVTLNRLFHETRMNLLDYLLLRFQYSGFQKWSNERQMNKEKLHQVGPAAFSEKCLDRYLANWYVASMATFFPHMKRALVDKRGEDIFRQVQQSDAKRVVVVVNQWHMENFEHHWAHHYGQLPRSVDFEEPINPIGDMNLREGLFEMLYNALHRRVASAHQKSVPTTFADMIIGYHRESNFQYEHRDM